MFAWLVKPVRNDAGTRAWPGKQNAWRGRGIHAFLAILAALLLAPAHAVASGKPAAVKLPSRKAGLWEVTILAHSEGLGGARQPAVTVRQCTRPDVEPVMLFSILPGQENCGQAKVVRRGDKGNHYEIAMACRVHDNPVHARMTLRGDLQTVYAGSYAVDFSRTPEQNVGPVAIQGRWLGHCAPGQKPGDMVLPNGITVNPVDDAERRKKGHTH